MVMPVFTDGLSAKLNIGKIEKDRNGTWLLPFWRETSGPACWGNGATENGVPGILSSSDKVPARPPKLTTSKTCHVPD